MAECDPAPKGDLTPSLVPQINRILTFHEDGSNRVDIGNADRGYNQSGVHPITDINEGRAPSEVTTPATIIVSDCLAYTTVAQEFACTHQESSLLLGDTALKEKIGLQACSYQGVFTAMAYDTSAEKSMSLKDVSDEQVFQAIKVHGQAGVCRNLTHYSADYCASTGLFKVVGTSTMLWSAGLPTAAAHVATILQGNSGKYYLVNYFQIFEIDATSALDATKKAAQYFSPATSTEEIEFKKNRPHLILSDTAQAKDDLKMAASRLPKKGGSFASISSDGFSAAARKGNFELDAMKKNNITSVGINYIIQFDKNKTNAHGTETHFSQTALIGASQTSTAPGLFMDNTLAGGGNKTAQTYRGFDFYYESHYSRAPGGGPLHLEVDTKIDEQGFRRASSANVPYTEFQTGLGYYPKGDLAHAASYYAGIVSNAVTHSTNDVSHIKLDSRLEFDYKKALSQNTSINTRIIAAPGVVGYNLCGTSGGKNLRGGFCESQIRSDGTDAFYIYPEVHKIFVNYLKCIATNTLFEASGSISNGQTHDFLNTERNRTPGGSRGGGAFNVTLSNKTCIK